MTELKSEDKLELKDLESALESINIKTSSFTFFAYWSWWEALGRPNDFYGYPMYVYCSQDGQYHSPEEIKEYGW